MCDNFSVRSNECLNRNICNMFWSPRYGVINLCLGLFHRESDVSPSKRINQRRGSEQERPSCDKAVSCERCVRWSSLLCQGKRAPGAKL